MIRLCSIFLFICLGLTGPSIAKQVCENPVFGVSAVEIDKRASTASEAQIQAMDDAQTEAFAQVLDRLLISELPADVDLQAQDFIELVHIQTETSLPGRYLAEIDICFSPKMIRGFFADYQLSWAEVVSPPVLVVPVFASPAGVRAWQKDQPWLMAWQKAIAEHDGLVNLVKLKPTLANERQLQAERLYKADEGVLAKAASRAKAEQILLIRAQQNFDAERPILIIRADLHHRDGSLILSMMQREIDISASLSDADQGDIYREIIETITSQLNSAWRASNARTIEFANKITVHLSFDDLKEWVGLRKSIEETKAVIALDLLSLTTNKAVLSLELAGSADSLRYGLAPVGLEFVMQDGVGYIKAASSEAVSGQE